LRQRILKAGYLCKNSCDSLVQCETFVLNKKSANAAKVYCTEEILKIDVEDVSAIAVFACVGSDGAIALKAVGDSIWTASRYIDLGDAILKQVREPTLD